MDTKTQFRRISIHSRNKGKRQSEIPWSYIIERRKPKTSTTNSDRYCNRRYMNIILQPFHKVPGLLTPSRPHTYQRSSIKKLKTNTVTYNSEDRIQSHVSIKTTI